MNLNRNELNFLKEYNFALCFLVHAALGDVQFVAENGYDVDDLLRQKAFVVGTQPVQQELLKQQVSINARPALAHYVLRGVYDRFGIHTREEVLWGELELDANQTALERACQKCNFYQADWLLGQGADIKNTRLVGGIESVLWLVKHGADVNQPVATANCALLYYAFSQPEFNLLDELLLHLPQFVKTEERHLLECWGAVKNADVQTLRHLREEHGGDGLAAYFGETFLLYCMRRNLIAGAEALLKAGADPNAKDQMGRYPLTEAISMNNKGLVQLLLSAGVDVHLKDTFGRDAVTQARDKKAGQDIISLLE